MEGFIMVPLTALGISMPDKDVLLLGLLISNSKQHGYAYGRNQYYAEKLSCSTRTITKLLAILEDRWFIKIEDKQSFRRRIVINQERLTNPNYFSELVEQALQHNK